MMIAASFLPGAIELMIICSMAVLGVVPFWMICSKAGFPGWLSLVMFIPMLNLFLLFFLAFAEWPALKAKEERERYES
ncbi:hypothetical protein Pan153_09980 [Gimesia panareensis]|uniref:Uncharacterized protein n=1 Tax=Gimesia panareensis TaxID=2527978 RepID=A0A518FJ41_9PLAN|nr:hypothetical protein [Gimesia panareensis]QDV16371.1 hypothetical protein Pan153_09980 [Gimesia panareensis]